MSRNTTGFFRVPEDINQNYAALDINVNLISDVYVASNYAVVVVMASGREHYVTLPQETYEAGKVAKSEFIDEVVRIRKNAKD